MNATVLMFARLKGWLCSKLQSGTGTVDPSLAVTDEDAGDTFTYSIDQSVSTESSYFSIDSTTGEISFALNYDVDVSHPTYVELQVVCTDTSGDTGV